MKALVAARLMRGDISNWTIFENELAMAERIANRNAARNVSRQIGRGYRELSFEINDFIKNNFISCGYADLAHLLDDIDIGTGLSMRLDEFEKKYFPLANNVKRRIPAHAHVHISTFGLQFQFPEQHFLGDIETSLPELLDTRLRLAALSGPDFDARRDRDLARGLVAKEKFLSRSIISATFSLAEAFLSGIFFTAVHYGTVGSLSCSEEFAKFATTKESAPLRDRLDRVVKFVSEGAESVDHDPFKTFIESGKRYRDAIHHTTPFQRKDVEAGGRLIALYEIDCALALRCVILSAATLLKISRWSDAESAESDIAMRCDKILQAALAGSPDYVVQIAMEPT
jgi:hypothetical protein